MSSIAGAFDAVDCCCGCDCVVGIAAAAGVDCCGCDSYVAAYCDDVVAAADAAVAIDDADAVAAVAVD